MISRRILKTICICASILCSIEFANAYVPSYYSANSKLSSGHWVKIKVTEMGMQEISYDQLRELGFSDPSKVCVYGYGGAMLTTNTFDSSLPDDLPAVPVYYGKDKLIFYGEGDVRVSLGNDSYNVNVKRNIYSSAGYYFISDCNPTASQIPSAKNYSLSNIISQEYHNCIIYTENDVENPAQAGAFFFDKNLISAPSTYSFNVTKPYNPSKEPAGFRYEFAAKAPSYMALKVDFEYPDSLITDATHRQVNPSSLSSQYYYTNYGEIYFTLQNIVDTTYSFNVSIPSSSNPSYAAVDYAYLSYRRCNDFEGESQMRMSFSSSININQNTNFIITNGNPDIQVWNVTNPTNIYPHATKYYESSKRLIGSFDKSYTFATTGNACLIAFDPNKEMHKVEIVGEVENQNLHNLEVPDMVIITNNLCRPYAEQLAQAHQQHQGLDVLVITQDKIFNEFSSGTPSAMGYRRFLKMFYDRNKSKFKYLLLFGEGSWDNRGVIYPKEGRLLTYQAEDIQDARSAAKAYCADNYFGMLNDDFTFNNIHKTEVVLGIGRIPAQSQANAQAITNKIINYLENPPTIDMYNRAIFLADEGDSYGHIIQQEENIDSLLSKSPNTICSRAYSTFYPSSTFDAPEARDFITRALTQGQGYFNFAGHGGESAFTAKDLWSANIIKETSYSYPPIAMFATCDAFAFDRKDGGMAEQSLYKTDGGFIATVAASRTVYMQFNQYINNAFTCELFSANENDLIGDVFRRARNKAATKISDRTLGVNTLCYNLAGDPALPLYRSSLNITTTAVNNVEVDKSTYQPIYPLAKNTISGKIVDNNGQVQESFNGTITISVYDCPTLQSSYTIDKNTYIKYNDSIITEPTNDYCQGDSVAIIFDETLLTEVTATVTNGIFDASFVTPLPTNANSINRVTYSAISNDKSKRASGGFNLLKVTQYHEEKAINDNNPPIIEKCYINDPSFCNGDIVGSEFILNASIKADETGLFTAAGSIGSPATLVLDNNKSFPLVQSAITHNADGSASLSFPLSDIEDGKHSLTLSISDNAGNYASHTLHFVVINKSAQAILYIDNTPARTDATFDISHNFIENPTGQLIIEDISGNAIFSKKDCSFPYTWNLKDNNDSLVPDGNYKAYVILKGGAQYGSSDKIEVIVVK